MNPGAHPRPWTSAQAQAVAGSALIGALIVGVAAVGAGQEKTFQHQIPWLNVAVLGLLVAVVAEGGFFLAARRAVGHRRLELIPDVATSATRDVPARADGPWWWVTGTTRAHVAGCPMIAGKSVQAVSAAQIQATRLTRCELCG